MGNFYDIFGDYFNAYKTTAAYKDNSKIEIMLRRKEFEELLDKMWANYGKGMIAQLSEYNKQLDSIKSCGLKVLRNSAGEHKIVLPK